MRQMTPAGEPGRQRSGALAAVSGLLEPAGDEPPVATLAARRARARARPPPSAAPALLGRAACSASAVCGRQASENAR